MNLNGYYVVIGKIEGGHSSEIINVSKEVLALGPISAGKFCVEKWREEHPNLDVQIVFTYGPYSKL